MIQSNRKNGFTIVELMLSMAFVGALLLAIALTSMQIMKIYTKGITLREVNQAGRAITEDLERTIGSSAPFKVDPIKTGTGTPADLTDSMYVKGSGGGRLCTGEYTYVWNNGEKLVDKVTGRFNFYNDANDPSQANANSIRFVKVSDPGRRLCTNPTEKIIRGNARELLSSGDRDLAIQELTVFSMTQDAASDQQLYAISLTLGTNDQQQLNVSNTTCLPNNTGTSGSEKFCAINQFSIIARAGNQSGSMK